LRGIANTQTRGCYWLAPQAELLDGLDQLLEETHEA
jgi:exodeoxyribonuclease V beta subunit